MTSALLPTFYIAANANQNSKTKVVLVGTGSRGISSWGTELVGPYRDYVDMVGLCDINPGRLAYAKNYIGVKCPVYTNFDEMLDKTDIPAELLSTLQNSRHIAVLTGSGVSAESGVPTWTVGTAPVEGYSNFLWVALGLYSIGWLLAMAGGVFGKPRADRFGTRTLVAAFELGRRMTAEPARREARIQGPADVFRRLGPALRDSAVARVAASPPATRNRHHRRAHGA